jgi:hypothetical protein
MFKYHTLLFEVIAKCKKLVKRSNLGDDNIKHVGVQ